jgi:hypothetical protein
MKRIDGITLPDEAVAFLEGCKAQSKPVLLASAEGGSCPNCGGMGYILLEVLDPNSKSVSPRSDRNVSMPWAGAWWSFTRHQYACPLCNEFDVANRVAALFDACGLQDDERGWHLDYIDGMDGKDGALRAARELLGETPKPSGWSVMVGSFGVGKSGILKSLTAGFIRAGVQARYVRAADILTEIRSSYDDDADVNESELRQRFGRYQFLAIDELDRLPDTRWAQSTFAALIDDRYNARRGKATWMATNARPDALGGDFGYLESRLRDARRIPVGGIDLRGRR